MLPLVTMRGNLEKLESTRALILDVMVEAVRSPPRDQDPDTFDILGIATGRMKERLRSSIYKDIYHILYLDACTIIGIYFIRRRYHFLLERHVDILVS